MENSSIRALIFHEQQQGRTQLEATNNINATHGVGTVSKTTVGKYFKRFKDGEMSMKARPRSGRPVSTDYVALSDYVKKNPTKSLRESSSAIGTSTRTVGRFLRNLGLTKKKATLTPHNLSPGNKTTRVNICRDLLGQPRLRDFLKTVVTGDESWILYDNTTRQAYWLPKGEKPPAQPSKGSHPRKIMLCCFWDMTGMIWWELLDGQTVDGNVYSRQLLDLANSIKHSSRRRLEVNLLHDNARPHKCKVVRDVIFDLKWKEVDHPPYSPDIAPSDYHLFRPLKAFLRNKKFMNYDDVHKAVSDFIKLKPKKFWADGIEALPDRWQRVIDARGSYFS